MSEHKRIEIVLLYSCILKHTDLFSSSRLVGIVDEPLVVQKHQNVTIFGSFDRINKWYFIPIKINTTQPIFYGPGFFNSVFLHRPEEYIIVPRVRNTQTVPQNTQLHIWMLNSGRRSREDAKIQRQNHISTRVEWSHTRSSGGFRYTQSVRLNGIRNQKQRRLQGASILPSRGCTHDEQIRRD